MTNVNYFLKVLKREGYPNPNIESIAKMVGYDLDNFLVDLKEEIGEDGVLDFCKKAIDTLQGEDGIKVVIESPSDEYYYLKIKPLFYDEDESPNDVISTKIWGDTKVLSTDEDGNESYMTIEDVIDNSDMGTWAEVDELVDMILARAYNIVYYNCGFGIWWE